jgi:cystathionine beta-lyase/cystathionine gamma-synthase
LSFELKEGAKGAANFLSRAQVPISAPSLGGVETLMTLPAKTSHAGLSADERRAGGISDGLIRISVGIESIEDLLEDFQQALG